MQAIPEHKNEEQDSDFDSLGGLSPDEKTTRNILGSDKEKSNQSPTFSRSDSLCSFNTKFDLRSTMNKKTNKFDEILIKSMNNKRIQTLMIVSNFLGLPKMAYEQVIKEAMGKEILSMVRRQTAPDPST